jgi:hypothetical protein
MPNSYSGKTNVSVLDNYILTCSSLAEQRCSDVRGLYIKLFDKLEHHLKKKVPTVA